MSQGTNASVVGKVLNDKGEPLPFVTIILKNESTSFNTGTTTNTKGEYSLKQLPLGSPYTVKASFIGYGNQIKKDFVLNQGDLLSVDIQLKEELLELNTITVVANSLKKSVQKLGSSTSVTIENLKTLPVNGLNCTVRILQKLL